VATEIGRGTAALALAAISALLIGCGLGQRLVEARSGGLADRCADFMTDAFPSADIRITKREAANAGIDTIVAHVEGTRKDVPQDVPLARDLAVECRFTDNVLTGFRWTAGPLH
jgi:hypothetical protein